MFIVILLGRWLIPSFIHCYCLAWIFKALPEEAFAWEDKKCEHGGYYQIKLLLIQLQVHIKALNQLAY